MRIFRITSEKRKTTRMKLEEKGLTTSNRRRKVTKKKTNSSLIPRSAKENYTNGSYWKRQKSSSEKDLPDSSMSSPSMESTGSTTEKLATCCMRISSPWRSTTIISKKPIPFLLSGWVFNPPTFCQNSILSSIVS
jgi:hypothetical protein